MDSAEQSRVPLTTRHSPGGCAKDIVSASYRCMIVMIVYWKDHMDLKPPVYSHIHLCVLISVGRYPNKLLPTQLLQNGSTATLELTSVERETVKILISLWRIVWKPLPEHAGQSILHRKMIATHTYSRNLIGCQPHCMARALLKAPLWGMNLYSRKGKEVNQFDVAFPSAKRTE